MNSSVAPLQPARYGRRRPAMTIAALTVALLLAGATTACTSDDGGDGRLTIRAAFYPLAFLATEIGGDLVDVENLTRPGVEAHDLELRARDVAGIVEADLLLYLGGFQAAIDDAVGEAGDRAFDVAEAADLVAFDDHGLGGDHDDHDHDDHDDHDAAGHDAVGHDDGHEGHDHDESDDHAGHDHDEADDHAGHDHGHLDPHFWLDPTRMAAVAEAVRDRMIEAHPQGADTFRANTAALLERLGELDESFSTGLDDCDRREIVTNHAAFGYLTDRYGLTEYGITGITPDEEPTSGQLVEAASHIEEHGATTVFYEPLVSPAVAETVAAETGTEVAVLDPLEGITDASPGDDYLSGMEANLGALRSGLGCR